VWRSVPGRWSIASLSISSHRSASALLRRGARAARTPWGARWWPRRRPRAPWTCARWSDRAGTCARAASTLRRSPRRRCVRTRAAPACRPPRSAPRRTPHAARPHPRSRPRDCSGVHAARRRAAGGSDGGSAPAERLAADGAGHRSGLLRGQPRLLRRLGERRVAAVRRGLGKQRGAALAQVRGPVRRRARSAARTCRGVSRRKTRRRRRRRRGRGDRPADDGDKLEGDVAAAGQAVHQLALGPRGEVHVPVPRAAVSMRAGAGERAAPQRIQEHSTLPSLKPLLTRQVDTSTHAKSWSPPARDFAQRAVARLRPAARERGARAGGGATRWARATARGRARRRTRCRRARARRGGGAARVQQRGARRPWRPSRARAPRDR